MQGTPLHWASSGAMDFVSGNQFTSRNENNRKNSPSALVGASLLARQTSATMYARHTTIHSQKHITKHSIIFAHTVWAGRLAPTWPSPGAMDFVSGNRFTSRYKNIRKNSPSGPTLLSPKQKKKSGVMPDLFVYFFSIPPATILIFPDSLECTS